ncbi:DUF4239 domain-containing protein [Actinospica sp. MGRD01-02]|uniref:DUF4239 domain-containing protein n=1 Tax=Actinospica acidithermotolerans TaxID=2828514 RepID=A0A941EIC6_9ACTN|nr:DUF4239 domain-containing protein [Actinospica acidithermotolerans]MBR7831353.1 DUF4239 domain-containing protein [Actinospica acidithermotolerans]
MGIALLVVLVLAALATLLVVERARKEHRPERKDAPALDYVNTFISTLYMVLLALVVVVQWQNVDQINSDLRTESTTLTALVQTAQRMPAAEGAVVRRSAIDYADAVLAHEWPPPSDAAEDAAARAIDTGQAAVTHPVAAGDSLGTIEDQAIGEYQALAAARDDRLAASNSETSPILIVALGILSLITILTPLALGLRADALAFTGLAVTTLLVCLSFWFVLDLDSLYHGLIHTDATPLHQFLDAPGSD